MTLKRLLVTRLRLDPLHPLVRRISHLRPIIFSRGRSLSELLTLCAVETARLTSGPGKGLKRLTQTAKARKGPYGQNLEKG